MIGAILGDIIGSAYEFRPTNDYNFRLFTEESNYTDDTVCTFAIADAILNKRDYTETLHNWCRRYRSPMGGYGFSFGGWITSDEPQPYNSFGNGAAMRVSSVGWLFNTVEDVLREAEATAAISHNHMEGIKGAQSVAYAILRARQGASIQTIVQEVEECFNYNITGGDLNEYRNYFDETCQGTIPPTFMCLAQAHDYESAVRLAVSLGVDADTIGAIVGGIAEALWDLPDALRKKALSYLSCDMLSIYDIFLTRVKKL